MKLKKGYSLILGILCLFMMFVLSSCKKNNVSYIEDDDKARDALALYEYSFNENKEITLIDYNGYITDIDFKALDDSEYKIVAFGDSLFSKKAIQTIIIPDTVKTIGKFCFSMCSLKEVVIPDSVTSIGQEAFYYNIKLESVKLSSNLETLGLGAFKRCEKLKTVTIPNTITTITDEAFEECNALSSVVIPTSVKSIRRNAFFKDKTVYNAVNVLYMGSEEEYNNILIDYTNYLSSDVRYNYIEEN